MAIVKKEIDKFITGFKESSESLIWKLEERIQENDEGDVIDLVEEHEFDEKIEILILSLRDFAYKSGIKITVGKIDSE